MDNDDLAMWLLIACALALGAAWFVDVWPAH